MALNPPVDPTRCCGSVEQAKVDVSKRRLVWGADRYRRTAVRGSARSVDCRGSTVAAWIVGAGRGRGVLFMLRAVWVPGAQRERARHAQRRFILRRAKPP